MIISENLLIHSGAEAKIYKKKDLIFQQGDYPKYYYQILKGNVILNNYQEDGQEFIQNIYNEGDSIYESSLFGDLKYAANAVANSDCIIYRLNRVKFIELMDTNSHLKYLMYLNSVKAINFLMMKNIIYKDPYQKIIHIIDLLKISNQNENSYKFMLPFTRQQLASITGLCTETVIRIIKRIEKNGELYIINGKVYL